MKSRIDGFINEIVLDKNMNWSTGEEVVGFKFYGDGTGDFEESSKYTTNKCIEKYILHCEEQIRYAKTCLGNEKVLNE